MFDVWSVIQNKRARHTQVPGHGPMSRELCHDAENGNCHHSGAPTNLCIGELGAQGIRWRAAGGHKTHSEPFRLVFRLVWREHKQHPSQTKRKQKWLKP